MSYSKVIPVGSAGSLTISEAAGEGKLVLSVAEAAGGSLVGVAKASINVEVDVSVAALVDVGLALAEAKYPSAAALIAGIKGIIDAEVATL